MEICFQTTLIYSFAARDLFEPLGGVTGLPDPIPPYVYLTFSVG